MADTKQLTSNVNVDGKWYGPDYPQNTATAEILDKITNPAAFEPAAGGVDLRFTAADFGVEEGEQPHVRSLDVTPGATGAVTALDLRGGPADLTRAPSVSEAATGTPPQPGGSPAVAPPAKSASKAEWVEYAVSRGADRTAADKASKDDLIDSYGG